MNRLHLWNHSAASANQHSSHETVTQTEHEGCPFTTFAPLHYEPGYAYPLIIWLHGPGDDERQLRRVIPEISMRNYVAVGPRGLTATNPGFTWSDQDFEAAERAVFECMDEASQQFNIAPHRMFVGGYEAGGTMAMRVALMHPHIFAGALSVGGPFPLGLCPLAQLESARRLPLFIAQGRTSALYGVERTCEELRLFHAAGLSVSIRQYPCGDELTTQMLRDMDAWMMELVTGIPAQTSETNSDFGLLN